MIQLHLGCGKCFIPGFVHIDLADFPHIDHKKDIATLPMFEDSSVDLIYSSHTLEYFDRIEVVPVLKEWRRVLNNDGFLRIAVPDFESLSKLYSRKRQLAEVMGPLYGRWPIPGSKKVVYHKTTYDYTDLKHLLEVNGFKNFCRYDWHKTIHKDYDDYSQAYIPHMDKKHGTLISLNVEAQKDSLRRLINEE